VNYLNFGTGTISGILALRNLFEDQPWSFMHRCGLDPFPADAFQSMQATSVGSLIVMSITLYFLLTHLKHTSDKHWFVGCYECFLNVVV
jgi:hypothetical protein